MTEFPESGVKLVADTESYVSAMEEAISLAGEFDALGDMSVTLDASVDTSGVTDELSGLDETVALTADVSETDATKGILDNLNFLAGMKKLETVWNIAGNAVDLFKSVADFAVTPMLDLDDAVAKVNAQTGGAIPNARELIKGIFYDDLGDSIDQVAKVVTKAQQLQLPVEAASRAALTFTHTWTDQDPSTVIETIGTLVKTNLVKNVQDAADLMTVFFQQGGNKGGDAIQVVNQYAQSWSDMGLSGTQALSTINTLMQGGVDNASDAARMVQTLDDSLTTAAANANSPQAQQLKDMGIENPKEKGQAMGADFIDGFAAAFANLPSDKQDLVSGTLLGKGGKKFTGAIEAMSTDSGPFQSIVGAADIAAQQIDDSLRGAIDDFSLAAQAAAEDFLSSDQIDLPGKIAALKTGLQDGLSALQGGAGLGEALEIALKPIGFDDEFHGLESSLGNFIIALLQVVAQIQDITGHGAEAAGTRATVTTMAQNQLTFDLKVGNPEQIATSIQTAVSRGVTPEQIVQSVGTAVDELVKSGATAQAQALVDQISSSKQIVAKGLDITGQQVVTTLNVPITPEMSDDDVKKAMDDAQAKLATMAGVWNTSVEVQDVTVDPKAIADMQSKINRGMETPANTPMADTAVVTKAGLEQKNLQDAMTHTTDTTATAVDTTNQYNTSMEDVTSKTEASALAADTLSLSQIPLASSTKDVATASLDANLATSDLGVSLYDSALAYQELNDKLTKGLISVDQFNIAFQALIDRANQVGGGAPTDTGTGTPTAVPHGHAAGGSAIGTFMTGEHGRELVTSNRQLAVLNNMSTEAIMAALQSFIPGGNYGGGAGNSYTVNNTNIVPNQATADQLGYSTAKNIRGMTA